MFWAPGPLYIRVLGVVVVVLNVPAVMVNAPAILTVAFAPSCKRVPFTVALKNSCVPETVEVPMKLIVPAVAFSLPAPERFDRIEKLIAVLSVPEAMIPKKVVVPTPPIVGDAALKVIVPAVALNVPLFVKSPLIVNDAVVDILPDTTTLNKLIPVPVIVLVVPENVIVFPVL
jgi:hypothetical protein